MSRTGLWSSVLGCVLLLAAPAIGQGARPDVVPEGLSGLDWSGIQTAYLKGASASAGDNFGSSVAVSGNTVVVGAPGFGDDGRAFLFVRDGADWSLDAELIPFTSPFDDSAFGTSVAISGDTVVVGAPDADDGGVTRAGAVAVFVRQPSFWALQAVITASNAEPFDDFGWSVAIDGELLLVGAPKEDSNATDIDGDEADNGASDSGAAYVWERVGPFWIQRAYLKASNTGIGDDFGVAVALSGDTAVVAAEDEDSAATGVDGAEGDDSASSAGAVYVFTETLGVWSQQAYVKASNTGGGDVFGTSVSLWDDTLVVGAVGEGSNATGVDGDGSDNSSPISGAAYVFHRSGVFWSQQAYLKASNTDNGDSFGRSVGAWDETVVVGAWLEDSNATTVDGDQLNDLAGNAGAAYVFTRGGSTWEQSAYLKASNAQTNDRFGWSAAIGDATIVCGAHFEDGTATGVNGDQNQNGASSAGAAYVYRAPGWSGQGCALAGVSGDPLLVGSGTLADGSSNAADLSNAAPSATAGLFLALGSTPVPFKGGTLKPVPFFDPVILNTSASGEIPLPFVMPPAIPAGTEIWVQWAIQDAVAVQGVSLSNAIVGLTP
jgi:hypothetical protein